jgi:pyroglutamyl-peptidase
MSSAPILVTGFEPYGGRDINPAYEVMRALDGKTIAGTTVVGRHLSVAFASLQAGIDRMLDELAPSAIISLGLSPGETVIRIERLAVNVADFGIADNDGIVLRDNRIVAHASDARFATLPVRQIEQDLLAAGIPARLSMTAGTFLCNACLYGFLHALAERSRVIPCGFIHLPHMPEQVAAVLRKAGTEDQRERGLASMELSRMIRAVEIAIAATLRSLQAQKPPG